MLGGSLYESYVNYSGDLVVESPKLSRDRQLSINVIFILGISLRNHPV